MLQLEIITPTPQEVWASNLGPFLLHTRLLTQHSVSPSTPFFPSQPPPGSLLTTLSPFCF